MEKKADFPEWFHLVLNEERAEEKKELVSSFSETVRRRKSLCVCVCVCVCVYANGAYFE